MEITKEYLEECIRNLQGQADQLTMQLYQVEGAIGYCHQLTADLEQPMQVVQEELPTVEEAVSQAMPGAEVVEILPGPGITVMDDVEAESLGVEKTDEN